MSQIREIKDRMNGIQSTMKITKAMYMISSLNKSLKLIQTISSIWLEKLEGNTF